MALSMLYGKDTLVGQKTTALGPWLLLLLIWTACIPGTSDALDLDVLIDRIQANYDRTRALTADFVQVAILTSIDRQQRSAGHVSIEKPHFIRWEYTLPDAQTILYDGITLRIYTPKRRQMLQSTIDEDQRRNVALLFLAGMGKLRETFTITPLPTTDVSMQSLRLLPRSRQASFTELHIAVNTQSYFIEQLTIHDTIGNVTDIRLSSLQVHQALPPQTFELTLPPQTEILTPTDVTGRR
jgi:outer membrane lipoprotein carrier protein